MKIFIKKSNSKKTILWGSEQLREITDKNILLFKRVQNFNVYLWIECGDNVCHLSWHATSYYKWVGKFFVCFLQVVIFIHYVGNCLMNKYWWPTNMFFKDNVNLPVIQLFLWYTGVTLGAFSLNNKISFIIIFY